MSHTPGPWDNQLETHDDRCEMYSEGCGCESREKLKKECDALRAALRAFVSSAMPVSRDIDARGHSWVDVYLDEALLLAQAALKETQR